MLSWDVMKKREGKRGIAVSVSDKIKWDAKSKSSRSLEDALTFLRPRKSLDASKWSIRNPEKNRKGKNKRKDQTQEKMKKKRKNASQMKLVISSQKMADIVSVKKNQNISAMHK